MMRRIRRPRLRWLVAVIAVLATLGAAAGAWATTRVTPTYAATGAILVGNLDRPSLASDFAASGAITTLYGDMVRGDTVLGPVIDRLGLATDVAELRDRVHVDVDPNGIPIITFTVYARTKAEATATAHAIAERMMALSRGALSGVQLPVAAPPSPSDASGLQISITRVERKLARLHGLANSAPPAHRRPIERRIARMNDLLILLQEDYRRTVRVAEGSPNQLQVVTPAEAKPGRIRPLLLTDALLGATIGALAGCMLFVGVAMRRRAGSQPSAPAPPLVRDAWAREVSVAQEA